MYSAGIKGINHKHIEPTNKIKFKMGVNYYD